jgi:Cu-Zn family superoxide dismutase
MASAVAVFSYPDIQGEVVATNHNGGLRLVATFTRLPSGKHGFHIHKAGDLRGEGCMGLCEHFDIGKHQHGGPPHTKGERHTGDLGNIELKNGKTSVRYVYELPGVYVTDLWGRSVIVHEDEDDLGKGPFEDSLVTGHAGKRIGCAIFGRGLCPPKTNRTRKQRHDK